MFEKNIRASIDPVEIYKKKAKKRAALNLSDKLANEMVKAYKRRELDIDGKTIKELYGEKAKKVFELLFKNDNTIGFFSLAKKEINLFCGDRVDFAVLELDSRLRKAGLPIQEYSRKLFVNDYEEKLSTSFDEFNPFQKYQLVPSENIVTTLMNLKVNEFTNLYINFNPSRTGRTSADDTFSLMSIVKDIDCHRDDITSEELHAACNRLCDDILHAFPEELRPNIINKSGRGLHLVFRHEKCAANLMWVRKNVSLLIDQLLVKFFNEHPEYNMFNLDVGNDNPEHFYRIPFTYNVSGQTWGDVVVVHKNMMDINVMWRAFYKAVYGVDMPEQNRAERRMDQNKVVQQIDNKEKKIFKNLEKKLNQIDKKIKKGGNSIGNLLRWRCALIEFVVNHMTHHVGFRNKLLYNYLYAAVQCYSADVAEEKFYNLNSKFSVPLSERELRSTLSALKRNGYYDITAVYQEMKHYKQETWLNFFSGIEGFDDYVTEFRAMRRERSAEKRRAARIEASMVKAHDKEVRNQEIHKLSIAGYLKKEIADIVGVSIRTIYNVLHGIGDYMSRSSLLAPI
ncbi:MAG: hypothetical protein UIM53_03005 [Acutalibacteraceae bacterium]|nr:hypothetical protein [Acutalibacteraceae bacterium]